MRNPRDVRLHIAHRNNPLTPAQLAALTKGAPGYPHAWVGNDVKLQWNVSIPALGAGDYADFSSAYSSQAFSHGGNPWVGLVLWAKAPLCITAVHVYSAPNLGLGTPGTFASLDVVLHAFSEDKATKSNHSFGSGGLVLSPSAGSNYTAARLTPTLQGTLTLEGFNFNVLGLQVQNSDGSPSLAGDIQIVLTGHEYGQEV